MSEIADLYRGPLADFVQRRTARAKELRSTGDRAGADKMKALRKPSRVAWSLDLASASEEYALLTDAVRATVTAQSRGGDVRGAMTELREAIRTFARHALECAAEMGERLDESSLISAVFAVLGDTSAFEQLRRGELADIPAAGGLDSHANLTITPKLTVSTRASDAKPKKAAVDSEKQLAELRKASDDALRALNIADSELDAAEKKLDAAAEAVADAKRKRAAAAARVDAAMKRMKQGVKNA
jgi:hypothetical protein